MPFSLESVALRRIAARVSAVLNTLEPVIATLVGFVVLGEALSTLQWVRVLPMRVAAVAAN
ncbi:EamA family transporter [Streptomyces sp. PTM05]|uniref:EamA family transporter n=1 Tax=Streptantibioticus parmotrematis TaxID=2873249 RepID=A0ABS7R5D0_9ACTN|nr:EamA family transporter [Streptantibioticus parmotrematis]